jgi:hypothetical protein
MRLNHDCIRDILLFVEENVNQENNGVKVSHLISAMQTKYDEYTINYHIIQLNDANLFKHVIITDGAIPLFITDLSYEGHEYMDNIRDNKIWSNVKAKTKGLSSVAFSILVECAKQEVKNYLFKP